MDKTNERLYQGLLAILGLGLLVMIAFALNLSSKFTEAEQMVLERDRQIDSFERVYESQREALTQWRNSEADESGSFREASEVCESALSQAESLFGQVEGDVLEVTAEVVRYTQAAEECRSILTSD